jgi:hypothetical protein
VDDVGLAVVDEVVDPVEEARVGGVTSGERVLLVGEADAVVPEDFAVENSFVGQWGLR